MAPGGLAPLGYLRKTFNFIRDEPLPQEGKVHPNPEMCLSNPPPPQLEKKRKKEREMGYPNPHITWLLEVKRIFL